MKPDDKPPKPHEKYFYFVDGEKLESDVSTITGAIIRSQLPEAKRNYALYQEGHGSDPDTQITNDNESISLEKEKSGPKRFYTVPAATFGFA